MSAATWTEEDTQRAIQFWADYQKANDVSGQLGQTAGIDPHTGEVFFGTSAKDVALRLMDEGIFRPLYFVTVGKEFYGRKGRRQ
jgi:hypothetical protein